MLAPRARWREGGSVGSNALNALRVCSARHGLPGRAAMLKGVTTSKFFFVTNVKSQSLAARRRRCPIFEPTSFYKCFSRWFHHAL